MNQTLHEQDVPTSFDLSDLRRIPGLVAENPDALNESLLRWQLRHRHENGLAPYVVNVGKNVLISKSGYERWLAQQAGKVIQRRRRAGGF